MARTPTSKEDRARLAQRLDILVDQLQDASSELTDLIRELREEYLVNIETMEQELNEREKH